VAKFLVYLLIVILSGCATLTHLDDLLTLKQVADSQADAERYLNAQKAGFRKLKHDIEAGILRAGLTKSKIVQTYSEPILAETPQASSGAKEKLLYREPTKYFHSERIYLYLDDGHKLLRWEIKPAG
jgi:hypothetical protein